MAGVGVGTVDDMNDATPKQKNSNDYTGGCACGAIRYAIAGAPMVQNDCQCGQCQRRSGTGHGSYLTFASRAAVTLVGEASHWNVTGDGGTVKRHAFCPTCGAPVYMTFVGAPDLFSIHAGSLDEPGRYAPQFVTYTSRGNAWDHHDPALPRFEKMPPAQE